MDKKKYTEEQLNRWKACYHEAGHAVVTFIYNVDSNGQFRDKTTEELAIFKKAKDYDNSGHKAGGYYAALFYVNIGLSLENQLDVYLAGFAGEQLNPFNTSTGFNAGPDTNPSGDVQTAERLCKQISPNPTEALLDAKLRLCEFIKDESIKMAICDLAKFLFVSRKEIAAGDTVDEIILNGWCYGEWRKGTDGEREFPYERVKFLEAKVGERKFAELWPDDGEEHDEELEKWKDQMAIMTQDVEALEGGLLAA